MNALSQLRSEVSALDTISAGMGAAMSKHSKLPWTTDNVDVFCGDTRVVFKKVCHLTNNSEDGKFIVRACNNFDDLIEACRAAADALTPFIEDGDQAYLETVRNNCLIIVARALDGVTHSGRK